MAGLRRLSESFDPVMRDLDRYIAAEESADAEELLKDSCEEDFEGYDFEGYEFEECDVLY